MATLAQTREKLVAKQTEMSAIAKEAGTTEGLDFAKVKGYGFEGLNSTDAVEKFTQMNNEMGDLLKETERLKAAEDAAENVKRIGEMWEREDGVKSAAQRLHPDANGGREQVKTLGEMITENASFKSFRPGSQSQGQEFELSLKEIGGGSLHTGMKTIMTTAAGWAPESLRTGRMVDKAVSPIDFLDLIPGETTNQANVVYMEETTYTNNAIETDEGTAYTAAALALTQRTSPVRKIAVYLPVTDEQLEDVDQAQAYINNRLPFMIRQRLNQQALKGVIGSSPTCLEGLQVRSGVQTYALSAEPVFDAVVKGMDKVINTGQAVPDAFVPNASDWWLKFRLARTPDGVYILGNPTDSGPEQLWGLKVAPTQQQTVGTGLVGSFAQYCGLAIKKNLAISVGFINDDFKLGQQSIRCEMRVALQSYRPAAFCTVTGL